MRRPIRGRRPMAGSMRHARERGDPRKFRASGLVLWLRADLGITLNGGDVSAWADQSVAGNDVSQGTAALQPAYNASDANFGGKPSLSFTAAAGDLLANTTATLVPTSSARTTFAVFKTNATGGAVLDYIRAATARAIHVWHHPDPNYYFYTDGVAVNEVISDPPTFDIAHFATWLQPVPGTLGTFRIDGVDRTESGGNVSSEVAGTGFTVGNRQGGGTNALDGQLAELVAYSSMLHTSAAVRVEKYQRARCAL